ncbi:hypothetical protein I553_0948 [Mycobacterium xenopi 4042]|uniref:Uncharacterized protein n=1 Tax=Mycobacterium xenopi 4042 TaxID=1299334 RepID=X7ZB34_MYCXE|nr:hypothetical protein I553_0948 [Mycobacterium xenopi 4042]
MVLNAGDLAGDVGLYARVVEAQLPTDVVVVQVARLDRRRRYDDVTSGSAVEDIAGVNVGLFAHAAQRISSLRQSSGVSRFVSPVCSMVP